MDERVEVRRTGTATATGGGLAISGNVSGGIILGPVVRSAYQEKVGLIAPPDLVDREVELAELAAWCSQRKSEHGFVWWRAPAWAGKSALLSSFVLNPPPGIQVVSFFITARYYAQDNRTGFTEVVSEQLAALLGQSMPHLTESTRDAHFLGLLADAARTCHARGKRLVLVVDGLDEDRGVTGPRGHSIAALLPADLPADMRVIVAGRVNPPIPPDVPSHHPLRNPAIIRRLDTSPHAQVMRYDMKRELDELLHGPQVGQDFLGLLTAAGGGLSGPDLAELTGRSVRQVDDYLSTVAGRSFARRGSRLQPGTAPDVYILGHEELHTIALDELGYKRLVGYRQKLHAWADSYRQRKWPSGTPEYLLRSYFQMLDATDDTPRMISCGTDVIRHDRMLDLTGGDTAALTEIRTCQNAILAQNDPDLTAMTLLAVLRENLTDRNANIPTNLPVLWARLGRRARADALAGAITDPQRQARALTEMALFLIESGEHDWAMKLADQTEAAVRTITEPDRQAESLADLIEVLVGVSEYERAERLAQTITNPYRQANALAMLSIAWARAGQYERAETLALSIVGPSHRADSLAALASLMAREGKQDRAETLAGQAETAAQTITDPFERADALAVLAMALAKSGDHGRAQTLVELAIAAAHAITNPYEQADAFAVLTATLARGGEHSRAETLARAITDPDRQADALAALASALIHACELDRAAAAAVAIIDPDRRANTLAAVVTALALAGEHDRAEILADQAETDARAITNPDRQADALAALCIALAHAGKHDRADTLARAVTDPYRQADAFAALARALADAGEQDRSETVATRAVAAAHTIINPDRQADALVTLSTALAMPGKHDRAQTLIAHAEKAAHAITNPKRQTGALATLAGLLTGAGIYDRAEILAEQAETAARAITNPKRQADALATLGAALARAGAYDLAGVLARTITDSKRQADVLAAVAAALVTAGHTARPWGRPAQSPTRNGRGMPWRRWRLH